jgi:2-oxoisovalerate dehydrogenase E1 component
MDKHLIEEAILIRRVEESFLELFSQGKLNGTVHTCVGQEFSAVAFAGQLDEGDFIFSNHRCHGHYISFTKDYKGLIAELMGKEIGTCGGVGSSQHLCKDNFYSNGIQGGIVPVAAGMALANKLKGREAIGLVFIGDGTLGEGVVYETLNIVSKWEIPLLIVCENNRYSQSTAQETTLAGDILPRAEAFGIQTHHSNIWNPEGLLIDAQNSIKTVRETKKPVFHLVDTYRLNPHSKGDDHREKKEIEMYREKDPVVIFSKENPTEYR